MPTRSRRKRKAATLVSDRERERLLSYLPEETASPAGEEAEIRGDEQASATHMVATVTQRKSEVFFRDYSHITRDVRSLLALTIAALLLLVVLALVIR